MLAGKVEPEYTLNVSLLPYAVQRIPTTLLYQYFGSKGPTTPRHCELLASFGFLTQKEIAVVAEHKEDHLRVLPCPEVVEFNTAYEELQKQRLRVVPVSTADIEGMGGATPG